MSIKRVWKKLGTRWKAWWREFKAAYLVAPDPWDGGAGGAGTTGSAGTAGAEGKGLPVPSLASCWDGNNAAKRMMNILSPKMSEATFEERVAWMAARGCNTAHVFLVNKADGEAGGYNCATDPSAREVAKARMAALRKRGFCVVPWIIADDSAAWAEDLFGHAFARVEALASAGLFEGAPCVVLGLEMDEKGSFSDGENGWPKVASALRQFYDGEVGVHHCSGNGFKFAALGDAVFGQLGEGCSESAVKGQIKAIKAKGKTAFGFEYSRTPDRERAQWALAAGAAGVGNW